MSYVLKSLNLIMYLFGSLTYLCDAFNLSQENSIVCIHSTNRPHSAWRNVFQQDVVQFKMPKSKACELLPCCCNDFNLCMISIFSFFMSSYYTFKYKALHTVGFEGTLTADIYNPCFCGLKQQNMAVYY